MLQYFETLQDISGRSLSLDGVATCVVTQYPGGAAATIYATNGTAFPITGNTMTADITGQISAFIPDGAYILTYYLNGTMYKQKSPVQIFDPMGFVSVAATGGANVYVVNNTAYPVSLYAGLRISVTIPVTNTGNSTLNLNATGAKALILPNGDNIAPNELVAGATFQFIYNGTAWQLTSNQAQIDFPATANEIGNAIVPSDTFYPSSGQFEQGDISRWGGSAPNLPNAVFFDGSRTQNVIGTGTPATYLYYSIGTGLSTGTEFSVAFEYLAQGGGVYNNDAYWGVALFAAAKLSGGSRSIWAFNSVTEIDTARQASAFGNEADFNNNSGADVALTVNAYDQMVGYRAASGGTYKPQVAFQTWASSAAGRWRLGAGLANWSDYGLVIIQDPGSASVSADGTNFGTVGAAVTGPAIFLQPSSNGGNAIIEIINAAGSAVNFQVTQAGSVEIANNQTLGWFDSAGTPQTSLFVSAANNTYLKASPTGPGSVFITDQSLNAKVSVNATGLSFYGGSPVAQPTSSGNTATSTAGSTTNVFTNTTFTGGIGSTAYTVGDIVRGLKQLNAFVN